MKKILLLTTLIFSQLSFGQLIDAFNYTGALNANGWSTHSGTSGQMTTSTGSLTYAGLPASTGGKAVFLETSSEDLNIPITITGDVAYASFILSVTNTADLSAGGDYFFGIGGTAGPMVNGLNARTYIRLGAAANTFNLGIGNSSGAATFGTTDYPIGTPVFIVVSLDKLASPTVANLYVNPTPGAAIPAAVTLTNSINTGAIAAFASIYFRQGGNTGNLEIDELRAGSTYASVTPAGTAGCLIGASGIASIACNNAGTPALPADDFLTFDLNPTGATLGATYSVSVPTGTITPSTGTYGTATTFTLQAGSAGAGNVTITLTDAATGTCTFDQLITDPGACSSATPIITLTPTTLTGFNHTVGTPSISQSFDASGVGLSGDITLTAPTNFEISLLAASGFSNTLTLTQMTGVVTATTIFVRANASNAGALSGNITASSAGATNATLQVSGTASTYVMYPISAISTVNAVGVADSLDVLVDLSGVVYCIDFDGNAGYSFTLIDGGQSGINVFRFSDLPNYTDPAAGDSIRVLGRIGQFNGLIQVVPDSITLVSQGNTLINPTVITTLNEATESQYVKLENLTFVTPITTFPMGNNNIDVTDGTNTFAIRIDSDTDIPGSPAPQGTFSVTGIGGQFDSSSPFDSGYQLFPCSTTSFEGPCTTPSVAVTTSSTTTATATATGLSYQWIDCANNSIIAGATNQSFTALISGDYAVIVADGSCSDTSACVALIGTTTSLNENELLNNIQVYPNPVNDVMTIRNSTNEIVTFEIVDITGKTVATKSEVSHTTKVSTSDWMSGVYFVRLKSTKNEAVLKVVK